MISAKKVYPTETREVEQVTVHPGHPTLPRAQVVSPLRKAADEEQRLQMEIAERSAKLADARQVAIEIQDEFDSAVNERTQTRKDLAFCIASLAGSQARLLELQTWIERNFSDSPTHEQFSELYRHEKMAAWLPGIITKTQSRLAALDA